ncbi:unnamed protein product [Dovyalis caffra]|uniref:Uncharacterized protein n=1 Tax=Dovyalis caffra TaxID=77055 RepID=A0AAV1RQQ9_9ROSI|nr:unnamed protein product [Dovyalis caffra]
MEKQLMTILVATLAALLLLVDASIHQTTVIIEKENLRELDDCHQEMMRQENLEQCQEFVKQLVESEREGIRERRRRINPAYEEHLEICCQRLSEMSSMCRCYGLRKTIEQIPQERMMIGPEDFEEVMRTAADIPDICDLEPSHCQFDSPHKMW